MAKGNHLSTMLGQRLSVQLQLRQPAKQFQIDLPEQLRRATGKLIFDDKVCMLMIVTVVMMMFFIANRQ